ncbi:peptidylprolyl isomerase [Thermomonas carbonis]|uniref:Chaperone SurA n=1 Tax=Thermomonas carbonis TaxID=1463158 RepID=A0A7G9SLW2_9GAMM|nr:peptidylprolyl isomerase [Thermomonas carbonis]QNN68837.1 peptidylprolyl isomerase [Thermomonas carbonis]GHC08422.1 chaperone SurA [Thermomonas carbonis]
MTPAFSKRAKRTLLAAALASLLLGGTVQAQSYAGSQPLDRIAAVVNEDVILRSELDRAIANIRGQYAGKENQLPPADVLERQVLERLVLMRLQIARATDSGINAGDEELERAVQGVAEQNSMSVDQLRQRIAQDGMSFAEFRNNLRDEIVTQKLRQSFAQSRINVSEGEVDAAMATASATASQQFRLAHILVGAPDGATPEQLAVAQKKIEGVQALIDKGEMTFAAAAVRYSDSPNALEGGDLGWRGLNEIPPAFAQTIQQMQAGQVIGPIRGPSGFQLLQLVETRSVGAGSGEQVTQFSARQIVVKVDDKTDDATAKSRAETLAARITGGAEFAKLAAESSDDAPTKRRGGDMGWFGADTYGTDFGMQVASLSDGQTSAPFKTEAGWVIVQRIGSRQVAAADESQRAQVRETIGRRKLEEEWNRFLREMRGEAFVDVRNAEGKSTSPVQEGAAPNTPQKTTLTPEQQARSASGT